MFFLMIKIKHLLFIFVSVIVVSCQSSLDNLAEENSNINEEKLMSKVKFMRKADLDKKNATRVILQEDIKNEEKVVDSNFVRLFLFSFDGFGHGSRCGGFGLCHFAFEWPFYSVKTDEGDNANMEIEEREVRSQKIDDSSYVAELEKDSVGFYVDILAVDIEEDLKSHMPDLPVDEDLYSENELEHLIGSTQVDHLFVPKGSYKFDKNLGTCGGYRIRLKDVTPLK